MAEPGEPLPFSSLGRRPAAAARVFELSPVRHRVDRSSHDGSDDRADPPRRAHFQGPGDHDRHPATRRAKACGGKGRGRSRICVHALSVGVARVPQCAERHTGWNRVRCAVRHMAAAASAVTLVACTSRGRTAVDECALDRAGVRRNRWRLANAPMGSRRRPAIRSRIDEPALGRRTSNVTIAGRRRPLAEHARRPT